MFICTLLNGVPHPALKKSTKYKISCRVKNCMIFIVNILEYYLLVSRCQNYFVSSIEMQYIQIVIGYRSTVVFPFLKTLLFTF